MSLSSEDTYDKGEFNEEEIILTLTLATEELTIDVPTKSSASSAIDRPQATSSPNASFTEYQPLPAPASHSASY